MIKEGCYILNTNNGSFVVDTKDYIGWRLFNEHVWEPKILEIYKKLLKPNHIVIDVGSHMGYHTVNFGFNSQHVFAFEPQRHLYNQTLGNVFLNGLDEKITCYNVGLGKSNKKSSMENVEKHNTLNWEGNDGIELINYGGRCVDDNLSDENITIKTLDSFNLSPNFIKIDVEGYELKVFQGAKKTIQKFLPILFFECYIKHQQEVFKLINNMGYEIIKVPNYEAEDIDFIGLHPNSENYSEIKQILINNFNLKQIA